jgi:PAS fold
VITRDLLSYTCASVYPKHVSEALTRLQGHTKTSSDTAPDSVYIYDLVNQYTICLSYSVPELLGYTADQLESFGDLGLAKLIRPVDVLPVADHFQRFSMLGADEVIAIEYQMMQANGQWCWLRSQETPLVYSSQGFPLQILGLVHIVPTLSFASLYTPQKSIVMSGACKR